MKLGRKQKRLYQVIHSTTFCCSTFKLKSAKWSHDFYLTLPFKRGTEGICDDGGVIRWRYGLNDAEDEKNGWWVGRLVERAQPFHRRIISTTPPRVNYKHNLQIDRPLQEETFHPHYTSNSSVWVIDTN